MFNENSEHEADKLLNGKFSQSEDKTGNPYNAWRALLNSS